MAIAVINDGVPVAIPHGQDVAHDGRLTSFASVQLWSEDERNEAGIFTIVEPEPAPEGQVVASTLLEVHDGQVVRLALYEPIPLEQAKAAAHAAVVAKREAMFAAGFSPSSGPLEGHTLQVRNETDKINWLTSATSYSAAVAAGAGSVQGATFRTMANETVILTYAQGLTVIVQDMAAWGAAIMARSWVLKDAIEAASNLAAVEAIDITSGWPE